MEIIPLFRVWNRESKLILTQEFAEGNYYCGSAVAIAVKGRQAESKQLDEQTIQLTLKPGRESFTVYIATTPVLIARPIWRLQH